ncbi:hypothetical protein TPA0910_22220 [Streptomyces hygroscopicus subsp. sporocinereus]|uniref:Uncharacterized protein n=1 Tax=Streptomyces hygroscopicus TaxID=1912 RepID=A0ABQ3TWV5_STRHY|nr:hypothetical protein TPA0910_22220 [Streptomyces hygroscopicus]
MHLAGPRGRGELVDPLDRLGLGAADGGQRIARLERAPGSGGHLAPPCAPARRPTGTRRWPRPGRRVASGGPAAGVVPGGPATAQAVTPAKPTDRDRGAARLGGPLFRDEREPQSGSRQPAGRPPTPPDPASDPAPADGARGAGAGPGAPGRTGARPGRPAARCRLRRPAGGYIARKSLIAKRGARRGGVRPDSRISRAARWRCPA